MKKVICSFFLILFILPCYIFADEYATTNSGKIVLLKDNGIWVYIERLQAKVVKIIDGDTIKIEYGGTEENVRLIGIDTPESRANSKAKKDAERSGQDVEVITAFSPYTCTFEVKKVIYE